MIMDGSCKCVLKYFIKFSEIHETFKKGAQGRLSRDMYTGKSPDLPPTPLGPYPHLYPHIQATHTPAHVSLNVPKHA